MFSAAVSPDGKLIVTASSDYTARVWRQSDGETVATRMCHIMIMYKKGERRGETPVMTKQKLGASADESRADPGTAESEQTASAAEGTLGRGTRRAATSTDYGGPVARRRRADDGEPEQTRRARRGREQDFAEISRRMYEEIRSSRDPRDHVEDG